MYAYATPDPITPRWICLSTPSPCIRSVSRFDRTRSLVARQCNNGVTRGSAVCPHSRPGVINNRIRTSIRAHVAIVQAPTPPRVSQSGVRYPCVRVIRTDGALRHSEGEFVRTVFRVIFPYFFVRNSPFSPCTHVPMYF